MTRAARIIVVEDDDSVRDAIVEYLSGHEFDVEGAADARQFDMMEGAGRADLVILDVMLPGEDGLSICRRLRDVGPPVLMLSALGNTTDRVVGLEIGAADYLAKPFDPRELLARVRALLRRQASPARSSSLSHHFNGWMFDPESARLLAPDGTPVVMTAGELRMLEAFVSHAGKLLSRDQLLDLTHAAGDGPFDRAIDLAVSRLRRKLAGIDHAPLIETVRGLGYRFCAQVVSR